MIARRSAWLLAAAVALTLAIGIAAWITTQRGSGSTKGAKPHAGEYYVAIGDSFTAGGPIGTLQPNSDPCQRSTINYPSLVARELGYTLTDVSCVGATTESALKGLPGVPPQVDALTRATNLVTVSVAGNDLRMFSNVFSTCFRTSRPSASDAPCENETSESQAPKAEEVTKHVGTLMDEVRRRAPNALIIAVNYPQLMPAEPVCADTPFSPLDIEWLAKVEQSVSDTVRDAASKRDIPLIDIHTPSKRHALCSSDPWVNGARPEPDGGLLYHPNAAGAEAAARAIVDYLRRQDG